MRTLIFLLAAACGSPKSTGPTTTGSAADPTPTAPASRTLVNVDERGVGLKGHDPIGYTTSETAVAGVPEHTASHGGATYQFASAENLALFNGDPARYAPQYGGYCAYAASLGRLSPSDPAVFMVHNQQLLVFTNDDFRTRFSQDVEGNKRKADENWPKLVAEHGK